MSQARSQRLLCISDLLRQDCRIAQGGRRLLEQRCPATDVSRALHSEGDDQRRSRFNGVDTGFDDEATLA